MGTAISNHRTIAIDLRITPQQERRFRVFDIFDNLNVGDTLKIVYDHDLQPLYYRLLNERRGEFAWKCEQESTEEWTVWIKKIR